MATPPATSPNAHADPAASSAPSTTSAPRRSEPVPRCSLRLLLQRRATLPRRPRARPRLDDDIVPVPTSPPPTTAPAARPATPDTAPASPPYPLMVASHSRLLAAMAEGNPVCFGLHLQSRIASPDVPVFYDQLTGTWTDPLFWATNNFTPDMVQKVLEFNRIVLDITQPSGPAAPPSPSQLEATAPPPPTVQGRWIYLL